MLYARRRCFRETGCRTVWQGGFTCINTGALLGQAPGRGRENGIVLSWVAEDKDRDPQMKEVQGAQCHAGSVFNLYGTDVVLERRDMVLLLLARRQGILRPPRSSARSTRPPRGAEGGLSFRLGGMSSDSLISGAMSSRGGGDTEAERTRPVPEAAGKYPNANLFGCVLPAYGLYVRHVDGLQLDNVSFPLAPGTSDRRKPMVFDDVCSER